MNWFKRKRIARKLADIGSLVETHYIVEINSDEPRTFDTYEDAKEYLFAYRDDRVIYKLQLYRAELYTL